MTTSIVSRRGMTCLLGNNGQNPWQNPKDAQNQKGSLDIVLALYYIAAVLAAASNHNRGQGYIAMIPVTSSLSVMVRMLYVVCRRIIAAIMHWGSYALPQTNEGVFVT